MMESKKYRKTPEGTAVIAAFVYGIFTHLFALNNILHNYDNIASQPGGYGGGISLGRWLLEYVGQFVDKLGLNYNLSVINGVLYIGLIAITAGFLVSLLKIRSRKFAALIGMLFVAFPTATATLVYRYTAVFYGVGVLLAVLAVWVLTRFKYGFLLSALLIAASLGLYQAYVPLTIGLFVLLLIQQALEGETDAWKLVYHGLYDCAVLILGLLFYFVGLKISEAYFGATLTEYQGVGSMGNLALQDIPGLVIQAFLGVCSLGLRDYCGVANRAMMRIAYLMLGIASTAMILYILAVKVKKVGVAVITCLLCLVFPVAVNFIVIMCPDGWVYTLMVYAFALIACLPLVLFECMPDLAKEQMKRGRRILAKSIGLLTALLVLYYAYYANVNYTTLYYANRQIENYLNSIVVQVRMTEGFTSETEWVFIGEVDDPLFASPWEEEAIYGGSGYTEYLLNQYSRPNWIQNYIGYTVPMASDETVARLMEMDEVKEMPCMPDAGSIKVIENTVVIKFQDVY